MNDRELSATPSKMKTCFIGIGLLALWLACSALSAQEPGTPMVAGTADRALARDLLRELIEINTTPAIGSTRAAEAMAARLRTGGFAAPDLLLIGPKPDRQNVVVRLRGRSRARPILLIAHLDVVDAPREGWSEGLDPFRLTERDGYLYGRGVIDNKNAVAALVANLLRLRSEHFVPDRDILVAMTADEEAGTANGVAWLMAERRDLMDIAFCLNLDAGGGHVENGRRARLTVQTCEKASVSFRAEVKGAGGHSSLPVPENAIYRLAAGLVRLSDSSFPFRFNDTTRAYFQQVSKAETGRAAEDMRAIAKEPPDLEAARRVATNSVFNNAILHTTAVATRLEAGHANNALPQSASAVINCRVFPGDTLESVQDALNRFLADPEIKLTPISTLRPSPVSPLLPEVVQPIERVAREMWPGVPVVPVMDPWASDSIPLRKAGIPTFGISGTFADDSSNAHGANERLSTEAFDQSVDFLYRLLKTLTGSVPAGNRP
jgi:acetylornithine deacetylase/succinyl-diaminopimelate desuccinylase-like protein